MASAAHFQTVYWRLSQGGKTRAVHSKLFWHRVESVF